MKKAVKWISLLIIPVMLMTALCLTPTATPVQAASLNDLYGQLNSLNQQQQQYQALINSATATLTAAQAEVEKLSGEIRIYEDKIQVYNGIIAGLDAEIGVLQADLDRNEKELAVYYEIYYERVRANYEAGQTTYLDVLLGAGSFTDYLTRVDVVEQIMTYDNNLIKLMNDTIDKINEQKTQLEEKRAENEAARAELDAEQTALETTRAKYQKTVNENRAAIAAYEAKKHQAEEAKKKLNDEIDRLINLENGFVGGAFTWPTPGITWITSRFGYRSDPFTGKTKYHNAIDIGTPSGTALRAANSGTVVAVSYEYSGGYYIAIDHGGGFSTRYFHLSAQYVKVGQTVARGELIGRTGSSGAAVTGPHLHFEFHAPRADGSIGPVNPLDYVTPY
ncbi:MAG: peptidoglycan DD-metalloendopeptidase family protein [Clostridia bacterium]|nr:peptidoglycan DD-metalloendopeptidase family protein [Clostridia bacterium]